MNYERLREILRDYRFPLALLCLEAFHHNLTLLREDFQRAGKEMRLCTKSVRCGPLIEEVLDESFVNGVMIYDPHEAPFLAERYRARDILLGYPIAEERGAEALCQAAAMEGTRVTVVADNLAHLDLLDRAAAKTGVHLDVVVEVDVAYRPAGGLPRAAGTMYAIFMALGNLGPVTGEPLMESLAEGWGFIPVFLLFAAVNIVNLPLVAAMLRLKRAQPQQ